MVVTSVSHPLNIMSSATETWHALINMLYYTGLPSSPRGMRTKERMCVTTQFAMDYPVVMSEDRKLNYSFMAAEALWILSGSNTVADIAKYNKHIAKFSDDGEIFNGAYGPPIVSQLDYVVRTLNKDRSSRQAVLVIWKPNPVESKDIPCTVSMGFTIRGDALNAHVHMRSSDAWLGWPYDVFNFSVIALRIASMYNELVEDHTQYVKLGQLYLTMNSSHLYEPNFEGAKACIDRWYIERGGFTTVPFVDRHVPLSEFTTANGFNAFVNSITAARDRTDEESRAPYVLRVRG